MKDGTKRSYRRFKFPRIAYRLLGPLFRCSSIRQRNVLTRSNGLRLRYLFLPQLLLLFLALGSNLIAHQVQSSHVPFDVMSVEPSSGVIRDTEIVSVPVPALDVGRVMTRYEERQERLDSYISMLAITPEKGKEGIVTLAAKKPSEVLNIPPVIPAFKDTVTKIKFGDTITGLLQKAGLSGRDAYLIVLAMEKYFDPRNIRAGQEVVLRYALDRDSPKKGYRFSALRVALDPVKTVAVKRNESGNYTAAIEEKKTYRRVYVQSANIKTSLYGSAQQAGIPVPVISDAIRVYSWDVDFQRDIRQGDRIEIMYERYETADGTHVKYGNILYANLSVNKHDISVYRFGDKGNTDYYKPDGVSIRKTLMKTPIDGARLSSGFGLRKHPVLGYNKMHKGLDFAAPTGTPVYAAGDGILEKAGRWSSYGNYVRIRHNSSLKTAYAHLHNFAKGVSVGRRVKQGQVIGYVGTTGRSTGPHLHYEILRNGVQTNPRKLKLPNGQRLKGEKLTAFNTHMDKVKEKFAAISRPVIYAEKALKSSIALR